MILVQHARAIERYAAVEGCLAAKREQDTVGALFLDESLHKIRRDGQEIDMVGHSFGGLDCGDVGVNQHCLDAFFAQGFKGL